MNRHAFSISQLIILALLWATSAASGCTLPREFRTAANPALQSGLTSILTGLVDGVFAVIEPEPETVESTGS